MEHVVVKIAGGCHANLEEHERPSRDEENATDDES